MRDSAVGEGVAYRVEVLGSSQPSPLSLEVGELVDSDRGDFPQIEFSVDSVS